MLRAYRCVCENWWQPSTAFANCISISMAPRIQGEVLRISQPLTPLGYLIPVDILPARSSVIEYLQDFHLLLKGASNRISLLRGFHPVLGRSAPALPIWFIRNAGVPRGLGTI